MSKGEGAPSKPLRRPQQRTMATRLRIIRAAMSQFARVGFDATTTRGIAEAADVPHSLVIYHFQTKDRLWTQTVQELGQLYAQRGPDTLQAEDDTAAAAHLKRHFAQYIRFSAENPDFFLMLSQENRNPSPRLTWLMQNHTGPMIGYLTELVRRAQRAGEFVDGDPVTLLYLFLGAATSPYRSAPELGMITGRSPVEPAAVQAHITLCERLFFRDQNRKPRRRPQRNSAQIRVHSPD